MALPASGAWRHGDPPGDRRFASIAAGRRFLLEGGGELPAVHVAYETWGTPQFDGRGRIVNAILLCHALTGDSHAAGRSGGGHAGPGWWDDLIGPGRPFDTDRWYVVCTNILGGCQGTTGPSSEHPITGQPYGSRFPVVTIRDMVRVQAATADHLGIDRWHCVAGGSMGGMQVLEWAVMFPERVGSFIAIATCAAATAQQIAYNSVQRSTIALDPAWRGGDYYDVGVGEGPTQGLAIARELAQVTYRSDQVFTERFGRGTDEMSGGYEPWQRFEVEGYLDYHGAKLCRRFDANSYLTIARAWDLHDVGRGRSGTARALARITAPGAIMSITTDALFYPDQQHEIVAHLQAAGRPYRHFEIDSPDGHDAFLLEHEQVGRYIRAFLDDVEHERWEPPR